MPFYRSNGQLIYFAHVPKCAGTSVTEYLTARFGEAGFEDRAFFREPADHPWTYTSPQHVTVAALERLIPLSFFDYQFSIVRHPVARLASIYGFQKRNQRTIGRFVSFERWLRSLPKMLEEDPYRHDGHAQPQSAFVPETAQVFKLEDGLDAFQTELDARFGPSTVEISVGHSKKARKTETIKQVHRDLIREIYAEDFKRFGYE